MAAPMDPQLKALYEQQIAEYDRMGGLFRDKTRSLYLQPVVQEQVADIWLQLPEDTRRSFVKETYEGLLGHDKTPMLEQMLGVTCPELHDGSLVPDDAMCRFLLLICEGKERSSAWPWKQGEKAAEEMVRTCDNLFPAFRTRPAEKFMMLLHQRHMWLCKASMLLVGQFCGILSSAVADSSSSDAEEAERLTTAKAPEVVQCWNCGKSLTKRMQCSRCKKAVYCNKSCQTNHWYTHKNSCVPVAKQTKKDIQ